MSDRLRRAMHTEHDLVQFDLAANRAVARRNNYSRKQMILRGLWLVGEWLVQFSPRPMFAWRRGVLRLFGAKIGVGVHVYSSTRFYIPWNVEIGDHCALGEDVLIYSLGKIRLGAHVTVSHGTQICAGTHDFSEPSLPLLKPPVVIEDRVWVGTQAFIGPGITVGHDALVGARAVVVRDVPALTVVAGNPAKKIRMRGTRANRTFSAEG